jgi:hypothetical protein
MHFTVTELEQRLSERLSALQWPDAKDIAWATAWLEACGYTGVRYLSEALVDERKSLSLERDAIGIDLQNVSCAYLAPSITREVSANGRAFLRNVRHGLFLLPFTVKAGIGIGCPIDPGFAVGGERHKNPYAEKLALGEANGIDIDDALWSAVAPA